MNTQTKTLSSGPAAAAMISAGIGSLVIGLMTTGAVLFGALKDFLNFYNPVGPLSGKTTVGILAWLLAWLWLNARWKNQEFDMTRAFNITMVLLAIALVLTFPPVFEAFE